MVIFGCGYVGAALAERAVQSGFEVWVHSRNAESLARVAAVPRERRVVADLHARDWHARLPGPFDIAVNLVSSAGNGIDGYRLSYLEGNRSIREWAEYARTCRFLYTSATSVYPQSDGEWVVEEDVPELIHLSPSGQVLRQAELEVLRSGAFSQRVVARLAGIYGPGRHLYLDRLQQGAAALPGDGAAWLNLIHLEDIVTALMQLAEAPLPGEAEVFNVVDDRPSRKQEIADWLAGQLGQPAVPFDPSLAGPRSARRKAGGALPDRRVSNRRIREVTGWRPAYPDFRAGYGAILSALQGSSRSGSVRPDCRC
jgi:nucleoside-diphosphate-sugar epimerase